MSGSRLLLTGGITCPERCPHLGLLLADDADVAAARRKGRQAGEEAADVVLPPGHHHALGVARRPLLIRGLRVVHCLRRQQPPSLQDALQENTKYRSQEPPSFVEAGMNQAVGGQLSPSFSVRSL